jgi:hypothetical protein
MARRVHGERSVGPLYGQRALLIQETVFLGTRAEADKALGAPAAPNRPSTRSFGIRWTQAHQTSFRSIAGTRTPPRA